MTSPARRQYLEIKAQHPDALLAYQVGDFYEFFDEDAHVAAQTLQIVLTARNYGPDERVPLAGVPLHAFASYAGRLVAAGHRVAVCEQVGPAGRGLVRREVTRILSPGTLVEPALLPSTRDNYLVAVALGRRDAKTGLPASVGLAYVEASTGAFACAEWGGAEAPGALSAELQRLAPAELLLAQSSLAAAGVGSTAEWVAEWVAPFAASACPDHYFDREGARIRLCRHFGTPTLASFGCAEKPEAAAAGGAIVAYLERMNPGILRLLTSLSTYDTRGYVEIDGRTWRALEVVEPAYPPRLPGAASGRPPTLLAVLDATCTPMGARLLRRLLLQPLRDRRALEERLDAVAELHAHQRLRDRLGRALDGVGDLERMIARVAHGTAISRELHALAAGLARVAGVSRALGDAEAPGLRRLREGLNPCDDARDLIARAIADPGAAGGRLLRPGYSAELDAQAESAGESRRWIAALEASERERTGIRSLKIGFNQVFGYYIEVTRPNLGRVPADYQRRQTLATGERYVTAELKEHEARVLSAEERIEALERDLYAAVLAELATMHTRLRATAGALAQADVWLALAEVARARGYVRPELSDGTELEIVGGRHAIVEAALDGREFIPNDTRLQGREEGMAEEGAQVLLLTGPNMAGKSTYLRQVATIALLAQIGSFVPAEAARIGLVDRIFARVGAEDDLARGLSTFMVEMTETAYILRHATARSLVILDEVGRGTSTTDGLAIARAVIEHLHDAVGARALFATHFHELAILAERLGGLRAYRMESVERDGRVVFLHRVVPGTCDASYGVQVARLAGLPSPVTERAAALLAASSSPVASAPVRRAVAERPEPYEVTDVPPASLRNGSDDARDAREVMLALAGLNIAAMTPLEALNLLFSLQRRALAALRVHFAATQEG